MPRFAPKVWLLSRRTSVAIVVACAFISVHVRAQAPERQPRSSSWRQIRSGDLSVFGNASAGDLRRAFRELQGFREAMSRLFPESRQTSAVPTWVVVLRDYDSFARFQPRDSRGKPQGNVGGYFVRHPDANVMVFGASSDDGTRETILHEYTHYFVSRNARSAIPTWLSEGLAEFYSSFRREYRGHTVIGMVPANITRAMSGRTFIPLRDIVAPKNMEEMWRWDGQIAEFYAESWALVHYVTIARKNPVADPLSVYLKTLRTTKSHDAAFKEAFGTDIDGMDKELRQYVRRVSIDAVQMDLNASAADTLESEPMLEVDVNALQARLLLDVGAQDDAEQELKAALKRDSEHVSARVTMARLQLARGRDADAIALLTKAAESAPTDGSAQYYLGGALEQAWRNEEALEVYGRAIKLNPSSPYPWIGLNSAALALRRDAQASAALQNALTVEWQPAFYWTQALSALRAGRDEIAASSLTTYLNEGGGGEDTSVYPLFVAAIANWRCGRTSDAETALANAEKGVRPGTWTASVLRFLQGGMDGDQLLTKASNVGENTEAHAYVAFKLELAGRQDDAVTHLQWVVDHGAKNFLEYQLAKDELKRIARLRTAPAQ